MKHDRRINKSRPNARHAIRKYNIFLNHYIYTYIIGHYNSSVRITTAIYTTYVVWINFIQQNSRFLRNFFRPVLFILKVFARNLSRNLSSRRRNIFIFSFWWLTWDTNPGFTYNKPTYHPLHYGDFMNT